MSEPHDSSIPRQLNESDVLRDPIAQFERWFADARAAGIREPRAMTLATASPEGRPSARTVLLRGFGPEGFVFYTHYDSRKGRELLANPFAALVLLWDPLGRQVRIEGPVSPLSDLESDAYFQARPIESRLGAWASPQSEVIPNREFLESRFRDMLERFRHGAVPRPEYWGGYRVIPETIELWQSRVHRLHDRLRYARVENAGWRLERLAP